MISVDNEQSIPFDSEDDNFFSLDSLPVDSEDAEQEDENFSPVDASNIFYVISKLKYMNEDDVQAPRMGKVKEEDTKFFQSFCAADNPLILNDFITTSTVLTDDVVLYFYVNLNSIDFLISEMEKIKIDSEKSKKYKDLSSKYNILGHKKDLWIYFHRKNIKKYTLLFANNINQITEFLDEHNVKSRPCVIASLTDLVQIKENMVKIINGEEDRFNRIASS